MNFGARTAGHSRLPPLEDWGYLQTSNNSIDTGPIFPLPTSFPSASVPLPISPAPSHCSVTFSSRSSPYRAASASPGRKPETISGTQEECNADLPSDKAQNQPQGTESQARVNPPTSSPQPQSRRDRKERKEVKPARRGQGRPRGRKSRAHKHLTDEEKAAAKLSRRARKQARREARAAGRNEKREARAAEEDQKQRLWLEARWRRTGVPYRPGVPYQPAILYKPPGSGAKSLPGQRLVIVPRRLPRWLPWQDLSEETDEDDWYDDDELSDEGMMQEGLDWSNGNEPMWTAPEQDREDDESRYEPMEIAPEQDLADDKSQYERADDSYDLGNESGLDSGEETEEENWSNVDPKTLLPLGIATNLGEEAESGAPSLQMPVDSPLESYFDCDE